MPEYDVQYQIRDDRGFPGDLKQTSVEAIGQQTEWLALAVSHQENVSARQVHVIKSRSK